MYLPLRHSYCADELINHYVMHVQPINLADSESSDTETAAMYVEAVVTVVGGLGSNNLLQWYNIRLSEELC